MMIRTCATCGTAITVTTRNPNRRYCSPRCRAADWHARNRSTGGGIVDVSNDVRDGVQPRNTVPDAVQAANGVTQCPHCRQELAIIAVVIPADAAHVQTPEVIT